jgi:lauroyl/myristoyl acyltransferase
VRFVPRVDALTAMKAASFVANRVPDAAGWRTAEAIGRQLGRLDTSQRRMLERHMRRVVGPEATDAEIMALARRGFGSYARYWYETFRVPYMTADELDRTMTFVGREHLDHGLAGGKGTILAMPHLGGWEVGGAYLVAAGDRVSAVVEALEPPELFAWFRDLRTAQGMQVVSTGPEAGSAILGALRANHLVCLPADRDITGTGVEVEMFGEVTRLPAGPATLALRTGAPLVPTVVYFRGRHHHAVLSPPLDSTRTRRLRDDVQRVTQALASAFEDMIRRAPDQWHLLQPNWPSDPGYRT